MSNWLKITSNNIKALKKSRGWNQEVLADKAGVSKSVIRDLEAANDRATSSLDTINKIAQAFDVSIQELLSEKTEESEKKFQNQPVSIFAKKMQMIPDDIYDLAMKIDGEERIWDAVRGTIVGQLKVREMRLEKKEHG